jgi:hypothetical protein
VAFVAHVHSIPSIANHIMHPRLLTKLLTSYTVSSLLRLPMEARTHRLWEEGTGQGLVVGSCEHCDEPSGSIKYWEYLGSTR